MASKFKHCLKRSRKKVQTKEQTIFHLDEPEETLAAKIDLHYYTSAGQRFYSTDKISNRKHYRQMSQVYDSWHGEKHTICNTEKQKQSYEGQSLELNNSAKQVNSKKKRYFLKSADFGSIRKRKEQNLSPRRKASKSIAQMDGRCLSIVPRMQSSVPSLRQTRVSYLLSKKKKINRSDSSQFNDRQLKSRIDQENNLSIEGNCIKALNQKMGDMAKQKKGFLNSTLKHKYNKKKNWISSYKRASDNISKIDQFRTTNQPLKKEINKIINLLQQQKRYSQLLD